MGSGEVVERAGGREGEEGKKEQVSYERADLPSSLSE